MRNSYPGVCYRCKEEEVKSGDGHFEIIPKKERVKSRWRLQHAHCAIIFRGTDAGKESDNA